MEPLRFEGVIASWNDARGFGFIEPSAGGDPVFVHARAFMARAERPQAGQRVSFAVEPGPQGRKRACRVGPAGAPRAAAPPSPSSPSSRARSSGAPVPPRRGTARSGRGRGGRQGGPGKATLWVLPAFAVYWAVLSLFAPVPLWMFGLYAVMSGVSFLAYAVDKASAMNGGWRTRESTLHLLALAGGWPGALLAQQFLRHKSAKAEFRAVFWVTVVVNAAALAVLCTPVGADLRRALGM
ncbi:cold shock and DUF1294 domain-containing protein [Acidovorax sp. GBBC 3334]|uniref:cold shock and DUF1294 domain-containing protein n=1 Tax=Acidovorax sp. GBBC 3334 TaxID=2940496 RepID=UPI00230305FA|nr:cold shock and DUF1294 domain-containing protein [Acidovorax sp. GBBC 3334]MDA8454862.1 cold shock and DUF1294 domain-containing protein [Acidovorax sp. GBBC 3334]